MTTKTIIISGCGFRTDDNVDLSSIKNIFEDFRVKINIGTAVAFSFAESNYDLILISTTISKLELIKKSICSIFPNVKVCVYTVNLLSEQETFSFVGGLPKNEGNYVYVHCAGMSAGTYKIENDNPYLKVEKTPVNLPTLEFESVVKSLLIMMQALLPILRTQSESRVVIVSSMSGIRAFAQGFSHVGAKSGLSGATRCLTLELNKLNIFVSEVLPGAVDTGLYDNEVIQKTVIEIGKDFGYDYKSVPVMPPKAVADAVKLCVESPAHIVSINVVAKGQWPHIGA